VAKREVSRAASRPLADLIELDPSPQRLWTPDELGDILRHQLSAVVEFDLSAMNPTLRKQLSTLGAAQGLLVKSFHDLFAHPNPPVELLKLVKDYAKANALHADSALPEGIAKVLYYLAIAVARIRCNQSITRMAPTDLLDSMRWAAALPWLGEAERDLLLAAVRSLESDRGGGALAPSQPANPGGA
jgi:hypothetical protein